MPRHIALLISDMQGGGAQRAASLLSNTWVERGDHVSILTFDDLQTDPFYTLSDKIDLHRLDLHTNSKNYIKALRSNLHRISVVKKLLQEINPDILLCFGAHVSVVAVMAAKKLPFPVIGCERSDPALYPDGIWRLLRNWAYPKADMLVVQTEPAAKFCRSMNENVQVIPNTVIKPDISGVSDIVAPEKSFIASLGRFSQEKGHDILIRAFSLISQDKPGYDLLLIGDGPDRQILEALADDLDLRDRIHFTGKSKNPFPVLARASLFVLPSRFEGFPNALCEAMALGLACISTKGAVGAEALIQAGKNGLLVPSENPEIMAQAMRDLCDNPEKAKAFGDEASKISKSLSLDKILEQWDRVISS